VSKYVQPQTEKEIMGWLLDHKYRVTVTRYGWHMDGVYSIVKPGVIVATAYLPELESMYKGWDICYPESEKKSDPIKHPWGGDHTESNYDVNILSVDEAHCILPSKNIKLIKFLERNGVEPIVCELRHKAFWDNGIHCMTQDLYREGIMENYLQL
jgi:N-dimethylarginine dimethylaminohydrolase